MLTQYVRIPLAGKLQQASAELLHGAVRVRQHRKVRSSTKAFLLEKSVQNAPESLPVGVVDGGSAPNLLTCRVCGASKNYDGFHKDKWSKTGRSSRCAVCAGAALKAYTLASNGKYKETKAAYRGRNAEAHLERSRRWRKNNPEQSRMFSDAWRSANRGRVNERVRKHREDHQEEYRARYRAWYEKNSEKVRAWCKAWREANQELFAQIQKDYRDREKGSRQALDRLRKSRLKVPAWALEDDLIPFYGEARLRSKQTGYLHVVDHVYPLKGKRVSGLHCPDNLRVIPAEVNSVKSNKLPGFLSHELWDPTGLDVFHE